MSQSMAAASTKLEMLSKLDGGYAFYRLENILIAAWVKQGVPGNVRTYVRHVDDQDARYPDGFSSIHLVSPSVTMPSAEERGLLSEMAQRYAEGGGCVAVLLPGTGFWHSALHATVTGIRMATRGIYPMQTFAEAEAMLSWFQPTHEKLTASAIPVGTLAQAISTIRAESGI